jgi:hypothetical protein
LRSHWRTVTLLLPAGLLAVALTRLPIVATGDGYSAYFPVVWGLEDGRGANAFVELEEGPLRLPAYSVLLFAAKIATGSLRAAVAVVILLSLTFGVLALHSLVEGVADSGTAAIAVILFLSTDAVLHAAFCSTPDLACFAASAWAVALVARSELSTRRAVAGGSLVALAAFLRPNALGVLAFVLVAASGPRPWGRGPSRLLPALLGTAPLVVSWVAISIVAGKGAFWLPHGPALLASKNFSPAFLPGSDAVVDELLAHPAIWLARAAWRGLLHGPAEVLLRASWWLPSVLALAALPRAWRAKRTTSVWFGMLLLSSWVFIAPLHFEDRYYLVEVAFIAAAAAWTISTVASRLRSPRHRLAALLAFSAIVFASSAPRALAHYDFQARSGDFYRRFGPVASAIRGFGPGCVEVEPIAYRLLPLRAMMRATDGTDRGLCVGETESTVARLYITSRLPFDRASPPPGLEEVPIQEGPPEVVLFRTSSPASGRR